MIYNKLLKSNYTRLVLLLTIGLLLVFLRLHSLSEPFERDLSTYAYVAHQMLDGQELYSNLVDIKPPGIYLIYMATELLGGHQPSSVVYMGVFFTLVLMFFIFFILKRISSVSAALLGSLIWALASTSFRLESGLHPCNWTTLA